MTTSSPSLNPAARMRQALTLCGTMAGMRVRYFEETMERLRERNMLSDLPGYQAIVDQLKNSLPLFEEAAATCSRRPRAVALELEAKIRSQLLEHDRLREEALAERRWMDAVNESGKGTACVVLLKILAEETAQPRQRRLAS